MVYIAIGHEDLAQSLWFLIKELAIVDEAIDCTEQPFAVSEACDELALIARAVGPHIDTLAVRQPLFEAPLVDIFVGQLFLAPAVLLEVQEVSTILPS